MIEINLFYTIEGKGVPHETELKHLSGYENSKPVRIGNNAIEQFQLDIYGSLIDANYFMSRRGVKLSKKSKEIVIDLVGKIKERWQKPDNSIWEVRDNPQHYTYSKVMAWVGVERAIRLCPELGIPDDKRKEFEKLEKEIQAWIWENCFDKKLQSFKQHPETKSQDATNLLFVLLQFLNRHEALTKTIILNTCKELVYKDAFVYRYRNDDGLEGHEGAFVLCSFWLISAMAMIEELDEAERLFQLFGQCIAPSGLFSEEINPDNFKYLGNFPQAFSHIGYIMSAFYINKYKSRREAQK